MRITNVYTKSGDDGTTGLVGGDRVPKTHPRIAAYGSGDELASVIGWARQEVLHEKDRFQSAPDAEMLEGLLEYLGNDLFTMNADLATRIEDRHPKMRLIGETNVLFLEEVIDSYNSALKPLQEFVLPGGSGTSSALHVARTVARRTERHVLGLQEVEKINPIILRYLNRLSDTLFVLARWANLKQGVDDVAWRVDLEKPALPKKS